MSRSPVWGITGWKNAGKTTLVERLVAEISSRGLAVSTLKHAHHGFDLDREGADSYRHREAGAQEVLIASGTRWALMRELRGAPEPSLDELLAQMAPADLVITEGWKRGPQPKVEVHRPGLGRELMAPGDPTVRAVAADADVITDRPVLDLNDVPSIADFILDELGIG